ncbi:MAG: hypothetical protein AMS27_02305 [Bacteroides sp. SM23_62_1]|nr:MAG: hypothetical protein AMS27_02305 [Bacteroides sp. SM23_62_1]
MYYKHKLYKSQKIKIGPTSIGGDAPIRVQSMTTTSILDTEKTIDQCIRIINAGADFVRLSVRSMKEAENLRIIQNKLRDKGINNSLIADVHFNPKIAVAAANIVDKVRINPGNFADDSIREKLIPLLNCCRQSGTAIRIGVNHGSLSNHILNKYGATPEGMIESAMEYLRICMEENFFNLVVSLKSSNTRIMIHANRLLVKRMMEENMNFPLHLGVTESGEGEDGRIRSAAGIGTLLAEGIGDTIRLSLTEDPENEIAAALKLLHNGKGRLKIITDKPAWNEYHYSKRKTNEILDIGGRNVPVVVSSIPVIKGTKLDDDAIIADFLYSSNPDFHLVHEKSSFITDAPGWQSHGSEFNKLYPSFNREEFMKTSYRSESLNFIQIHPEEINNHLLDNLTEFSNIVFILLCQPGKRNKLIRAFNLLYQSGLPVPVILKSEYPCSDKELYILKAASDLGMFFTDGLANGLWLENPNFPSGENVNLTFQILQATRARMFKTEYIACPSCGRTLFNIQDTLARVKNSTHHLKHLTIAVMGCIVNGPGEMADADYGFVGSGPEKITLYKDKQPIKKNIPAQYAVEELINLIKECGDWIEK